MTRSRLTVLIPLVCVAATAGATPWLDDFEAAKKAAAATGKPLVIDVTGTDWCAPCQIMETEVFSRPAFESASAGWVLLRLDHPRQSVQAERLRVQNRKFAEKYPFDGFPTYFVMDARGTVYGKHTGYVPGGVTGFSALVAGFEANRTVLANLTAAVAQAAPGADRARAQDALFRQAEAWDLTAQYGDLPLKIVQEDRDGKAGLKARYQVYNAHQRLLATWAALPDFQRAVDDLDQLALRAAPWPDLKQKILFTKGMILWNALGREIPARDTFRQVRDLVPGSPVALRAAELLDKLP